MSALSLIASMSVFAADPQHAENITVYHVNPHQYGAVPVNMVSNKISHFPSVGTS